VRPWPPDAPVRRLAIGPVLLGRPVPFRGGERSAIAKRPAAGPVALGRLGLEGDEQADKVHHGGPDMAVHHYPYDHYPFWEVALGGHDLLAAPGAFGENISTVGLTEGEACIGDRFRLGTALVEISQGRQPCWKIDHKFQRKGITARVVQTGRCGWYYRVLEPGTLSEGDGLELVERGHGEWSVERVFALLVRGRPAEHGELEELAALPALCEEWRGRAAKRAGF